MQQLDLVAPIPNVGGGSNRNLLRQGLGSAENVTDSANARDDQHMQGENNASLMDPNEAMMIQNFIAENVRAPAVPAAMIKPNSLKLDSMKKSSSERRSNWRSKDGKRHASGDDQGRVMGEGSGSGQTLRGNKAESDIALSALGYNH